MGNSKIVTLTPLGRIGQELTIIESIVGGSDTEERSVLALVNSDTNKTTFFLSSTNTYTAQAGVIETVKYNDGDSSLVKQLKSVSVQTGALPTAGQVILKYRKDEDTAWTVIFTNTTDNSISYESSNIESDGTNLPQFKEIAFRLECLGNVELTGYRVRYEPMAQNF